MNAGNAMKLAVLAPAFALAGCVSLGSEPPDRLLNLTAEASAPAGAVMSGTRESALAVHEPQVPAEIDVLRVPVRVTGTELAYVEDAVWVEKPARLFRRLLAETIRARGDTLVIDGDDPSLFTENHLRGTLRTFGYDVGSASVVVRYDAIKQGPGGTVETRRFEATETGFPVEAEPVGDALNRAANEVARQVADWLAE
ncbi:cholesterol transport system auxiliary component [Altererythrobacter xiamenensis]|uniref:Cholesterol transport system auxiliary component n=2 Tax=Altererythrobacter xiamenensis TaxID=1316679 RepID=A0A1Y6EI81_9SPHN|nr:cholesterol transport system auxiliary component [Altererythrobacter xiamenensis]